MADPARPSFDASDRQALAAAIDQLPEAEKLIVTLVGYEGQSVDDAGAALGLSADEAEQLHESALGRIAETLGDDRPDEQGET